MPRATVLAFLPAAIVFAQPGPVNPRPTNVDFSEGAAGGLPAGWTMPNTPAVAGYSAELRREGCPAQSSACVIFQAPSTPGKVGDTVLGQSFATAPYVGKKIRFGAWLGMSGIYTGDIELRMRVDHADGRIEFFDSPDGPVKSQGPQWREVVGSVASDAKYVSIWARFHPLGPAWISEPAFGVVKTPTGSAADQDAIRTLIRDFADARNAHDGNAAAQLYSENGEYGRGAVRGREALAALWGGLNGQVKRTIQSISFPGRNVASVSVAAMYNSDVFDEVFMVAKEADGVWRIRLHERTD
jgi:hypothetical protein